MVQMVKHSNMESKILQRQGGLGKNYAADMDSRTTIFQRKYDQHMAATSPERSRMLTAEQQDLRIHNPEKRDMAQGGIA